MISGASATPGLTLHSSYPPAENVLPAALLTLSWSTSHGCHPQSPMSEAHTSCPAVILHIYQKFAGRFSDRFYWLEFSAQNEKKKIRKKAVKTTLVGTGTKAKASIQLPKCHQDCLFPQSLHLLSVQFLRQAQKNTELEKKFRLWTKRWDFFNQNVSNDI